MMVMGERAATALFWDDEHGGQIVGFDTPRSPGSALKPFIYAQAIDRGLALPVHLVPDIPVHYTDYAPSNYDGGFTGLIPLEDALSHSLNTFPGVDSEDGWRNRKCS